jgi:hypothetical protein
MADSVMSQVSGNEIEITPEMIQAGGRALRSYSPSDERISHSEGLYLAEKVLRAALFGCPPSSHAPSEIQKP